MTSPARPNTDTLTETIRAVLDTLGGTVGQGMAVAALSSLAALAKRTEEWMEPFDGDGIEWHESLPSPYAYQASDFSKLVVAVHQYESRAVAAEALVAEQQKTLAEARTALLVVADKRLGDMSEDARAAVGEINRVLDDLPTVDEVQGILAAAVSDRTEETAT